MTFKIHLIYISMIVIALVFLLIKEIARINILEQNEEIITRYFNDVWNNGNIDLLDEIMSEEYINHNPGIESPIQGPKGLKPIIIAIRKGFPDLNYSIKKILVKENFVAVQVIMTGTHTGNFFGIEPTGKKVEVSQMQFERIKDGKMVEHWRVTDELTMMKQLGVYK